VAAKLRVIGVQHVFGGPRQNFCRVHGMTGVEQQCRTALDADVSDAKKQRARGLASALNSKQLARLIVLCDDRVEARRRTAPTVANSRSGSKSQGRSPWQGCRQHQVSWSFHHDPPQVSKAAVIATRLTCNRSIVV